MLFFSDILKAEVRDHADEVIGKIIDAAIKNEAGDFSPITGVLVRNKQKQSIYIPSLFVESYGKGDVSLSRSFNEIKKDLPNLADLKDIVWVKDTIIDKQIVDLAGVRVVRANDAQFGMVKNQMCLVSIDIGTRGLLRRMGLTGLDIFNTLKPQLVEWKYVRPVGSKLQLSSGVADVVKLHPADIANIIEKLNLKQGSLLLQALDEKTAARVLEEIEPDVQKILVQSLGLERAADVMQKMSVDELVDLMQILPASKSTEIMNKLPADSKIQKIKSFLEYDEDTAGGLMTTEYITATPDNNVEDVINEIRRVSHLHHSIYFVYILDDRGKFLGVVTLRKLLISEKSQKLSEFIKRSKKRKSRTVGVDHDILEVARIMTKYNLLSVPVLDKDKKLLGVVTVDDIMRHFVPKA